MTELNFQNQGVATLKLLAWPTRYPNRLQRELPHSSPSHAVSTTRPGTALASLIDKLIKGDQEALAALYDQTSRFVYGSVVRILQDQGTAEEVTLDVYLQVWRQASYYSANRGSVLTWLLTIARSRAIDRLRSNAKSRQAEGALEEARRIPGDVKSPEEASILREQQQLLREALDQLSPEQREVIMIAHFGGLSQSKIAEQLGLPLGTVKSRIRSGMMRLRECLQSVGDLNCVA